MAEQDTGRGLREIEERLARASSRLKYLRDSELLDYDVEDLYRLALREYEVALREVMVARGAARGRLTEPQAA
jgi:hypothetical protein